MMVDVHLRDGRTVLRFSSRSTLLKAMRRDVGAIDEAASLRVWIDRGQGEGFCDSRVQFLHKNSIALVEQLAGEERDAFLAEHDPDMLERFRAREREAAAEHNATRLCRVETEERAAA